MNVPQKNPLGLVLNIVEGMGLEVTYAYDNLVFIEHNAFLLEMDNERPDIINLYFNIESDIKARSGIKEQLESHAHENNIIIKSKGLFSMEANDDNTIKIRFAAGG